jgi:hypothetical protein
MQMNRRFLAPTVFLLVFAAACSGLPFWRTGSSPDKTDDAASGQATTELQDIHYNGYDLTGRFMIGAVNGSIKLDKRLVEEVSINLDAVTQCDTGQTVRVLVADRFPPPAQQEDLLILERGYWYGADVYFPLFVEEPNRQPGPACIELSLSLRSYEGRILGRTHAQAHREKGSLTEPDAGIRTPSQIYEPDAGTQAP